MNDRRGLASESGDDELAQGGWVGAETHFGVLVHLGAVVGAGAVQAHRLVVGGAEVVDGTDKGRRAHPKREELDAPGVELGQLGVGGDLLVHDQHGRVVPRDALPVVAEGDRLLGLGGLGQVRVGVHQVVGARVLGEESEH